MTRIELIRPDWSVPGWVHAYATTREGGCSEGDWAGLNLAEHVGDDIEHVVVNRARLREALDLPAEPLWLNQVHGCSVADTGRDPVGCEADAAFADLPGRVCAVLTADCLPVLFADREGRAVAAAHAGWRGLAAGVLEATLAHFDDPGKVLAWLGPAIGPFAFEVGEEVRDAFLATDSSAAAAFVPLGERWCADLYQLARQSLESAGIGGVYGGGRCTYSEPGHFYSYRRDGCTGRQASLIWLEEVV